MVLGDVMAGKRFDAGHVIKRANTRQSLDFTSNFTLYLLN